MDMQSFFTRQRASDGKKVPLRLPDGTATDFHLIVRSRLSDEFRKAREESMRATALKVAAEGKAADPGKMADEATLHQIAALIAGWNLPDEFTPENVLKFLREAPQIAEQVDVFAANDRAFFKAGSPS